ncbi:S-adenosyl-L-methionine-dependent methyltransferase [Dacryopinax primogenitus]|uniref:DNA (cytosine-5-)-methyltransferase n=1 Tax=Dacryopinax primogenitus (strain DJM 731) TaxID=1858805 RepID=M5GE27_DACPD|nr:S-adenosyl-L-methionine-dependent methyltransferase [Dacryopinax primogenitus]EJU05027.1 S-adenosyl-L-methionine-dependent methyltransferase [Dacryopinax primogenitus]
MSKPLTSRLGRTGLLHPTHKTGKQQTGPSSSLRPFDSSLLDQISESVEAPARGEEDGLWGMNSSEIERNKQRPSSEYHLHDFVYFRGIQKDDIPHPFRVGQMMNFEKTGHMERVTVQHFGRYDDLEAASEDRSEQGERDPRHLYASRVSYRLSKNVLCGHCVVRHYREFCKLEDELRYQENQFYVKFLSRIANPAINICTKNLVPLKPDDLRQCTKPSCKNRTEQGATNPHIPLKCLALFHGAGGLSLGLEQAGCIVTKWAIDAYPSAHVTLKTNFPDVAAILQDTNAVLRRAIELAEGKHPPPLFQLNSKTERCPDLPRPGEVDIIIGGPPCQGFSRLNPFASALDSRNSLIGNALSYVDFLHPRFVLLENVPPLLKMSSTVRDETGDEEHIENAFAKLIVSFLVQRGYQVRFKVLQAGQHGAPQGRSRAIFWAAWHGEVLPDFPFPLIRGIRKQAIAEMRTAVHRIRP